MKRFLFTAFVVLVTTVSNAQAPDTLSADTLKSSYLTVGWPDFSEPCLIMNTGNWEAFFNKVMGLLFEPQEDTVTVYGMAVGIDTYRLPVVQSAIWDNTGHIIGYYDDSIYYYTELNAMCDTSDYEEAYELWGLYKRETDTVADSLRRISPMLPVNVKLDTPTYVLSFSSYESGGCIQHTTPLNVYELFFHTPQVVSGPFYMATTNMVHAKAANSMCKNKKYYTWPLLCRMIVPGNQLINQGFAYYSLNVDDGPAWVFGEAPLTFAFPILAPPDSGYVWDTTVVAGDTLVVGTGDTVVICSGDTVVIGGDTIIVNGNDTIFAPSGTAIVSNTSIVYDTVIVRDTIVVGGDTIVVYDTIINTDTITSYDVLLDIQEADMLQRLTGVVPNPATGSARVVSSLGLQRVEAYDLSGRKVDDVRVSDGSLSATLDVSQWPSGIYMLRIHTTQGTVSKRLSVTR